MKVLYIMSSFNIYGGTPKKTLDLIKYFKKNSFLYVYSNQYIEFKYQFEKTGANIYYEDYGKNIFMHIKTLIKIIDENNISIVQTQFSMGEILGYFIKLLRPHIKLIIAFVGSFEPKALKKIIANQIYKKVDTIIFISEYVKNEKIKQFPILQNKKSKIIYNGTKRRFSVNKNEFEMSHPSIIDIAGLTTIKNISILIEAIKIIIDDKEVYLYIAGDGPERLKLEDEIYNKNLSKYIYLLGYQENVAELINKCDIFTHPCYKEGFGIAVAEAMMAGKPIIVSNAGALPELIEDGKSGLVVEPFDAKAWAEAILRLIEDKEYAKRLGNNAQKRAEEEFSIEKYVKNYENLYKELLEKK